MTSSATEEVAQQLAERQIAVVVVDLEMARRHIGSITVDYYGGVSQQPWSTWRNSAMKKSRSSRDLTSADRPPPLPGNCT